MSAALKQRLQDTFSEKPGHLDHMYIDEDEQIRDRHVEHLFEDCFYGKEIDEIFVHNFKLYFEALAAKFLPSPQMPPDEVFTDDQMAAAWVTLNFGLLYIGSIKGTDPNRRDEDFDHCAYEAKLRTRVADNVNETCYAPTPLHAILLTVVNVMRHVCHNYHTELVA